MQPPAEAFKFGRFTLDLRRCVLLSDGAQVPLSSRAFAILELLLVHRDRVVSRQEIIAHVWRGVSVAQNNLPVQMSALRAALSTDQGGERLILTLPGQGYRFVGDVHELRAKSGSGDEEGEQPAAARHLDGPAPTRRLWRYGTAGTLLLLLLAPVGILHPWRTAPVAPRFSIAVLPFRDLSSTTRQEYVADAVTDDLTTDLAHIPGSVVIARESAEMFKGRSAPAMEIGRALNVRYLLEGSIRNEDTAFHINVQLIDAEAGTQIWAQIFETPHDKVAEAQASIVRRIGSALDIQLYEVEAARSERERPNDPDALDLFFRARSVLDRDDTLRGFSIAQQLLRDAVRKQPDFAEAWAELAWSVLRKIQDVDDPDDDADFAEAVAAVAKAVALAPQGFLTLSAQASLLEAQDRCDEAQYSALAAINVDASSVQAWSVIADCMQAQGKLDSAFAALSTLLRVDPENPRNKSRYLAMGHVRILEGQYTEAIDLLRKSTVGDPEPAPGADSLDRVEIAHLLLVAATDLAGDKADARRLYAEYERVWPHRSAWRLGSYYTKAVSKLPGYAKLMDALVDAGMPRYEDEKLGCLIRQSGNASSDSKEQSSAFASTPGELPGVQLATAAQINDSLGSGAPPLILDVSNGSHVLQGANWKTPSISQGTDLEFALAKIQADPKQASRSKIVVMSDGPCGSRSLLLAKSLADKGLKQIVWFRGGEEAWRAAGLPGHDNRLQ